MLSNAEVDLVDAHTLYVGNQLTAVAARLGRLPLVVHCHIEERYHGSSAVASAQRALRRLGKAPDVTVAVSNHLREWLVAQGVEPTRVVVVHNGTELGSKEPVPPGRGLRLLCVARLAPVKGQEVLLEHSGSQRSRGSSSTWSARTSSRAVRTGITSSGGRKSSASPGACAFSAGVTISPLCSLARMRSSCRPSQKACRWWCSRPWRTPGPWSRPR